jgi:hypothetical protein
MNFKKGRIDENRATLEDLMKADVVLFKYETESSGPVFVNGSKGAALSTPGWRKVYKDGDDLPFWVNVKKLRKLIKQNGQALIES